MHTNCKTLSFESIIPDDTRPFVMSTPNTGIIIIFPIANQAMAPMGNDGHWLRGTCKRAIADPKHIKPRGTLAAPINVVASKINARGGCPSGAFGMGELVTGVKRALRGVMIDIGKAVRTASAGGESNEEMAVRIRREIWLRFTSEFPSVVDW